MKIPTKSLPVAIKKTLSNGGFSKREIEVKVKSETKAHGSMHAPEADNFDYGYTWKVNVNGGSEEDLQHGLKMNESKEVQIGNNEVVVDGDKHANYATLTVNSETYDKYFKPYEKAASLLDKISEMDNKLAVKEIGKTRSGKAIYDEADHPSHKDFTNEDHLDAAHAHIDAFKPGNNFRENLDNGAHHGLQIEKHNKAMKVSSKRATEKEPPMSDGAYKAIQTKLSKLAQEAHELNKSKKPADKQMGHRLQSLVEVCTEILGSGDADSESRIKALFLEANSWKLKLSSEKKAEFGYGEMQQIDSHGWADIKKAILASHKTSPYKKVTIKPILDTPQYGAEKGGVWANAYMDIKCQYDSDGNSSLHSVTARLKVTVSDGEVNIMVQTRYNQA